MSTQISIPRSYRYKSIADKLLINTNIPEDINECWLWLGKKQKTGHSKFYWKGKYTSAHRAFYRLFVRDNVEGLDIDHLCKNPPCVNPLHLEPVTSRTNTLRGSSPPALNILKTHCLKGHPFDEKNTAYTRKGNRRCRECSRIIWRKYYYKNTERLKEARNERRKRTGI